MGTCTSTNTGLSLVSSKPAYMNHKVLVVSKLDKAMKNEQLTKWIDERANKHIELLHVERLNKAVSSWTTLAIELNDDDFKLLSDQNFWEVGIGIKPYVGRRFWRLNQTPRPTPEMLKNSVRSQWT